jgi:ABC-type dipeptide/oligopeptide/nickel transport system permease subunit
MMSPVSSVMNRVANEKHRFRRRFLLHRLGVVGSAVLALLVLVAIFAPRVGRYSPTEIDFSLKDGPPSPEHLFGTDRIGRDVWTRVVLGTRVSLLVGAVAVVIDTTIALVLGKPGRLSRRTRRERDHALHRRDDVLSRRSS